MIQLKAINKCMGIFYWEPQSYNNWKGYTLGAFDKTGKPTIALSLFAAPTKLNAIETKLKGIHGKPHNTNVKYYGVYYISIKLLVANGSAS